MDTALLGVLLVIAAALLFAYTNGFHDAANAIATSISTRALTPRIALGMAAVGNLVGAYLGVKVAETVGKGLVDLPTGAASLGIVLAGVVGGIIWNFITWYYGLPSSSSHALFGGLIGATLAAGQTVLWDGVLGKVVLPMVLSPLVGFLLGYLVMTAVSWIFRSGAPRPLNRGFRIAQSISAAGMAVGHGMQDAAKTMGIIVLALYVGGFQDDTKSIPWWVYLAVAAALAAGTYAGGWRIIKTLGRKIIDLGPPEGFAAETVASSVLYVNTWVFGAPISTTHTITSAIMGVGATKGLRAVRWGVAGNIVAAWVLTFFAAGIPAAGLYYVGRLFF
ncbi:MAG: inorganic phosphate transporter [Stackebrandtia sp.]